VIQLSTLSFEALKGKRFQNLFNLALRILNHPSIAFLSPNVSYSCFNPNLCRVHLYQGPLSVFMTGLFSQYLRTSLANLITNGASGFLIQPVIPLQTPLSRIIKEMAFYWRAAAQKISSPLML